MLKNTGSGLVLLPHQLNDGQIQYEGYDQDNKHIFTIKVADKQTNALALITHSAGSFTDSDSFSDEIFTRERISSMTSSLCENSIRGSFRLTQYDATERLLSLRVSNVSSLPKPASIKTTS